MNEHYITVCALSFLLGFAVSIWPKMCIEKFRKMIELEGGDAGQNITFKKMKELNPNLHKQCLLGLIISLSFTLSFLVFGLLAWFSR